MPPPSPSDPADTTRRVVEAVTAITSIDDRATALQCVVEHACRLTGVEYGALMVVDARGCPSEMFHHGDQLETVWLLGSAGVPVTVHGRTLGLLYLADHDDGRPLSDEEAAVVRALVNVAGYVLDHSRTQAIAERRRVWLNHAAALSGALQPPFDFSSADRAVTDVALRAGNAVASTVARLVDGELVVTAISGTPPAWVSEPEHEEAVHAVLDGASGHAEAGLEHVVLLASMNTHLSPAGALAVYYRTDSPPEDFETELLGEFAEQTALALDRARAFQEREHTALVRDRHRIAQELHDAVIQRLFATGLHLQKSRAMATDRGLRERLALTMQDLDQTIRAIRETVFDLQGDAADTSEH